MTTSTLSTGSRTIFFSAFRCTSALAPVTRIASRRNAAFLPLLSIRWTLAPGRVRERASNRDGRKAAAGAEIDPDLGVRRHVPEVAANWRRAWSTTVGIVDGEIRLVFCCHTKAARRIVPAAFCVSRETGVSFSARALSALRSSTPCLRALTRFWQTVWLGASCRGRASHGRPATSAPPASCRRAWPRDRWCVDELRDQLLLGFIRQARQRGVIEIVRQREAFIAAIGCDVGAWRDR